MGFTNIEKLLNLELINCSEFLKLQKHFREKRILLTKAYFVLKYCEHEFDMKISLSIG